MIRGKEGRTKRDFTPSSQIKYFNTWLYQRQTCSRFLSLLNVKCIHAPQMQTTEVVTNVLATNFVPQPRLTGRLSVFTTHQTLLLNSRSHVQKNSRPNNQSGGDPEVAGRNRKREGRSASHLNVIRGAPTRARCDWLKGRALSAYAPLPHPPTL